MATPADLAMVQAMQAATQQLSAAMAALVQHATQGNAVFQQLTATAGKNSTAMLAVGAAYGIAASKMTSWISAGLSGTTTGEMLSWQVTQLSRGIASIFLPAINAGIEKLQLIVTWFRNLSGEQQANIARWAGTGVAILGTLTLLPRLIGGFQSLYGILSGAAMASPILALTAGVVALLMKTEEGRTGLASMGESLIGVFAPLVDILSAVLIPLIDFLAEALSSPMGQIAAFGTIAVLVGAKVVTACVAMASGFTMVSASLGVLGLLIAGLALIGGAGGGGALGKTFDDIAAQVRSGKKKIEDARKEIEDLATEQAFKEREALLERARGETGLSQQITMNRIRVFDEAARARELAAEGGAKAERAAAGGKARGDVVAARSAPESVADVLKRIETGSLKADTAPERTADATEGILTWLKGLGFTLPNKNNQDQPLNDA